MRRVRYVVQKDVSLSLEKPENAFLLALPTFPMNAGISEASHECCIEMPICIRLPPEGPAPELKAID
jgi:hypothetical protein